MVNDITVSKLNELALIEREKKLRLLADNSSEAIGIYSVDGTCKYMTPSLKKVFGYSPREIVGHKYTMLFNVVPPEDCNELKRGFNLNILKRETVIAAFRIRHKNGNYIWCQTSFTLVFDEDEEQNYILSVSSNVTEQITAKSELEKYRLHLEDLIKERTLELEKINVLLEDELKKQKEAEEKVKTALVKEKELNELKSNFITMVSHEFRTPLTSILSSAELIQRYRKRWTVEKTDEHLDQILDSIEYLNHMLDGVLTISRVESGKLSFSPQPVNLYQMCLDSISEVKHLAGSKHKIVFQYQLEMHIFILDPTLVHFILSNLLSNALKYSPGGGKVILGLSGYEEFIKITIQDYGIGMTDEYKRHCFESFVRGSNTAEIDGTGLGLSIVKKSVELHNGEIIYSSELGSGTVFIIKIPMVKI
jgi:PAS domain S-box